MDGQQVRYRSLVLVKCAALTRFRRVQRLPGVETEDFATALCSTAQVQSASDQQRLVDID